MKRDVMIARRTAYNHRKSDVARKLIMAGELAQANGSLTLIPYGDFFNMFRLYVAGDADENGMHCINLNAQEQEFLVHNESEEPQTEERGFDARHCERHDDAAAPAMSPDAGGQAG